MAGGRLFGSDMAARLRRKFVLVAMVSVGLVLTALIGGVNVANYINIRVDADELIALIAEYGGTLPTVVVGDFEETELAALGDAVAAAAGDAADDGAAAEDDGTAAEDDGTAGEDGDGDAGAGDIGAEDAGEDVAEDAGEDVAADAGVDGAADADGDTTADASEGADAATDADGTAATDADAASQSDDTPELSEEGASEMFEFFEEVHGRISLEANYETRYFTVTLDGSGAAVAVDTSYIAAITSEEAAAAAEELAAAGEDEGFYGTYRFGAVAVAADAGLADAQSMYIFVDCTTELESFETLLKSSVVMSCVGLLLVFLLVVVLSRFAVQPIAESYEKQKRFITDASHEIKTPLSVIDAADEVVEIEYGESEWTRSIHDQVARLADLTNRLVFLSRMDEGADGFAMEELSLTQVVEQAAEPYAAVALARGKELVLEVEPGVTCRGDSKALTQVVELLLDNAMSYASDGSQVLLQLRAHGRRAQICVQNECDRLPEGDLDRLFERFYRADSSRSSETGGSGVGLSVVRAIAEAHKGTARAEAAGPHTIRFVVEL